MITVYDEYLAIKTLEEEILDRKSKLKERCTHPKEFLKQEYVNNNPDPLQEEVRWVKNVCQMCGSYWRSNIWSSCRGKLEDETPR